MSDTQKQLQRAYRLINKQKSDEALDILRPLTAQEPDNPDVWWLMAYALDEPTQVREALITVLRLNPNYSNADRARELLQTLNDQHPPTQEEIARFPDQLQQYSSFPDAFAPDTDDLFASSEQAVFEDADALFADSFDTSDASVNQTLYEPDAFSPDEAFDESVFLLAEEEEVGVKADEKPAKKSRKERQAERRAEQQRKQAEKAAEAQMDDVTRLARDLGVDPESLDDEILADLEEKAARRQGRGNRLLRVALLLGVLAVVILAVIWLGVGGGEKSTDPGPLKIIDAASKPGVNLEAVNNDILGANLGAESRAVIAESVLGDTLFVEFCREPDASLPAAILRGMDAAALQAPALQGVLDAVGVSVNACSGDKRDSLYRASVSMENALAYSTGSGTPGEISAFQALWQTP